MEEAGNLKDKFKSVISTLQKSAECPVCLEQIKPPFKLCETGHGVCLQCAAPLEKCPLCQKPFTSENLMLVKNLLEALPHLCCYSNDGCEEVVEPGNDHEMFCGYRPITCREEDCVEKLSVNRLVDHYILNHTEFIKICRAESVITEYWKVDPNVKQYFYLPFWVFSNLFWILFINDVTEKQLKIFFQATPQEKLEDDYYVCIRFVDDKVSYSYTLKALVLSLCENKYDGNDEEAEELQGEYCMRLPHSELDRFTYGEQLKLTLFFFRE